MKHNLIQAFNEKLTIMKLPEQNIHAWIDQDKYLGRKYKIIFPELEKR